MLADSLTGDRLRMTDDDKLVLNDMRKTNWLIVITE